MENDSYDSKKLRKISAHLRQLKFNEYLTSRDFALFCEAHDIDEIWNEVISSYPDKRAFEFSKISNSYSDPMTDNLFKKFVIKIYFLKTKKFVEIVPEFISNYSKWSSKFYGLNEQTPVTDEIVKIIGEDLLNMRYNQKDVVMYFHHAGFNLDKIMEQYDQKLDDQSPVVSEENSVVDKSLENRNVFVVHGHNIDLKTEVEVYLRAIQVEPIILHQQVTRSKTIIEKVEYYSDVGFAVILLTADDVGSESRNASDNDHDDQSDGLKKRARQNVIFECGYFMGLLGRENVAILCERDIEIPSDIVGIGQIRVDSKALWKKELAKEIDAAGIKIDNKHLF